MIPESRSSRRTGIAYAVLLALSLVLLAVSGSGPMSELRRAFGFAFAPIQDALSGATRSTLSVFDALAEIDRLRRRNQVLEQRIQQLEIENQRLEGIRIQNEQLTSLLRVRSALAYETVAAEVIGRGISANERVITIDQGGNRGIRERDVVLAGGGALVGQVAEVGSNFSRVILINDSRSVVIGLVQESRATGEVRGRLASTLEMSKIPATDEVNVEDTIVTAGLELGPGVRSPFPKGLLIGTVVSVDRDPTDVVQTAFVAPAAPLDRLEYVLVITDDETRVAEPSPAATETSSPAPAATP